ncbi:MAG: CheR family methyltransferase [Bradymonadia bacterium]
MTPSDFAYLSGLVKERSGLSLTQDKIYLLESRLAPVARKWGANGLNELTRLLKGPRNERLLVEVTEAMTTNESFFFRDRTPFELFKSHVAPELMANPDRQRTKQMRIWSAACSSGQEAYSLVMLIGEELGWRDWKFDIVGSDISQEMVNRAKSGLYSQFEVQRGLPVKLLMKHFKKEDAQWRLNDATRQKAQFRLFNLMDDPARLGKFDVVFCRNVLIYFDPPTKGMVLERIARTMPSDGFLFLGGAETILGVSDKFKAVPGKRGVYQKV